MSSDIDPDGITLNRFLISQHIQHQGTGQFSQLMNSIQTACKSISSAVRRAGMIGLYGLQNSKNFSGDSQQVLDVLSDKLFTRSIVDSRSVSMLISEENNTHMVVDKSMRGKYVVAFDPLDGSSNIDCLGSIGSIFAIYEGVTDVDDEECINSFLRKAGRSIVAAGYTLYGSATMMVLAIRDCGVHGFTLDPSIGEFVLTDKNMVIGKKGRIFSINEGYEKFFDTYLKEYIKSLKYPEKGSPYSARYIGSMVADVHRTLKYGGIFMYPSISKVSPNGKLRMLYEAFPMSYIMEMAGGKSTDAVQDVLDKPVPSLHAPTPIFLGSVSDVDELIGFKQRYQ